LSTTTQINPTVPATASAPMAPFIYAAATAPTPRKLASLPTTTVYILQQELYRIQLGVENKRLRESAAKETNARKGHEDAVENVELEIEYLEDQLAVSKSRIKDLQSTIRRMELGSV